MSNPQPTKYKPMTAQEVEELDKIIAWKILVLPLLGICLGLVGGYIIWGFK